MGLYRCLLSLASRINYCIKGLEIATNDYCLNCVTVRPNYQANLLIALNRLLINELRSDGNTSWMHCNDCAVTDEWVQVVYFTSRFVLLQHPEKFYFIVFIVMGKMYSYTFCTKCMNAQWEGNTWKSPCSPPNYALGPFLICHGGNTINIFGWVLFWF
jgi:hypothetical protein